MTKQNCIALTKLETEDTNYRPADRRSFFTRQGSMLLGAYEKKEVQPDIVAFSSKANNSQAGRKFLIGSCKYKNERIGPEELNLIRNYASLFTNANDECYYYIFSKTGFTDALLEKQKKGEVKLVTMDELY